MKRKDSKSNSSLPWIGERYLLAEPIARLREERTPYFTEARRWHPAVVAGALRRLER